MSDEPRIEPRIDYPCRWDYQVIGEDEQRVRIAVAGIVGNVDYMLTLAHLSKKARYCSLHLSLEVESAERRLAIFEALRRHADVRYVL
jgi:putative lipoic acid-binding regulatory protein